MRHRLSAGLLALLVLVVLVAVWWRVVNTASAASTPQVVAVDQTPERERDTDPDQPEISFIDSQSPQCIMPEPHSESCYIQWYNLEVYATDPNYIISMSVTIDNRLRAYYSGFFQTSMYVPFDMYYPGLKVACGRAGASGIPNMGKTYAFTLRARETGGLKAANYGSVTCPADLAYRVLMPLTVDLGASLR